MDLRLGDCLDGMRSLPARSVAHIVTDAPYSEQVHTRFGAEVRDDGHAPRGDIGFAHVTREDCFTYAAEFARIAQRWIIVFGDEFTIPWWREALTAAGAEYVRKGAWVKTNPMPQMTGDRPANGHEDILIAHAPRLSGRMRWNGGGRPAVYHFDSENARTSGRKKVHPSQKPMVLMEQIVRDFTDYGEVICDPFAGSFTTAVACKHLGRGFVGWERLEKFYEAGRKRVDAAHEQLGLDQPKPKQVDLALSPEAA